MPRYEYQFGVYVDAANEQAAWEKVRPISEALDEVDAEGESATDLVGEVRQGGTPKKPTSPLQPVPHPLTAMSKAIRETVQRFATDGTLGSVSVPVLRDFEQIIAAYLLDIRATREIKERVE